MTNSVLVIDEKPLTQKIEDLFATYQTDSINDAEFFDDLMMRSKPLPWVVPGYETTIHLPVRKEDVDPDLSFEPDPRQLIAINLAESAGTAIRFVRLLESFGRVHLMFSLPYGTPSDFERRARQEDPMILTFKEAFLLFHGELKLMEQNLNQRITGLAENIKTLKAEQEKARIEASRQVEQLRQAQRQLATVRANQASRMSRASWRMDPVFVGLSVDPSEISSTFRNYFSQLYWHMIAWGEYQTSQQQQGWMNRALSISSRLINHLRGGPMSKALSDAEINQLIHWIRFSITNPGLWMMGVDPQEPDALKIRGR